MKWNSPTTRLMRSYNPKPERRLRVELTQEEERQLVADFKQLMKREPTEAEKESLFIEERKIKRGIKKAL